MTCKFRVFAPKDTLEYYTEDKHEPKYLTPLTLDGMPRVFKVRSEFQSNDYSYPAIALFKHHQTYRLSEPQIDAFLVKGYGIIPAKNLVCEGEIDYPLPISRNGKTPTASLENESSDIAESTESTESMESTESTASSEKGDNESMQFGGKSKGPLITKKNKVIKSHQLQQLQQQQEQQQQQQEQQQQKDLEKGLEKSLAKVEGEIILEELVEDVAAAM